MAADTGRALDPAQGIKPLDFGADGVTGSVTAEGRWIALNTYHARYGYVTLTTAEPFPEDRRYDPAAVRAYRAGLARLEGFGPDFGREARREARLLEGAIPHITLTFAGGAQAAMTAWARGGGAFLQWTCDHPFRWRGRLSLQRCAYTQLTEGGPLPMPPTETHARLAGGVLTVENPALGWAAAIAGFPPGEAWDRRAGGPIEIDIAGAAGVTTLVAGFGPTGGAARDNARRLAADIPGSLRAARDDWRARLAGLPDDPLIRRAIGYGRMLAVPVNAPAGETCCILTDHMLLPLSWNRDAYYVARALLRREPDIVRRHLVWMFEIAERPAGVWGRCYLANGQIKDAAFQLDQQLYPLLELAEYVQETGDRATWERLRPAVEPVIDMLLARKAPGAWLFPTDETPADDPVALPYHLSSHILIWHTFRRAAPLVGGLPQGRDLGAAAEAIRRAVRDHFVAARDGQTLYAYATDGAGRFHFYHDANDFPLALAPVWGFSTADDPAWRATLAFAFSEANAGGYYAGRLGSVHTPAPWPLGDVQDLLIARLVGDPARERRARDHLHAAAQWDGALPEAYDAATGAVVSRHWFAWPNAALACVALGAFEPRP